jgi:hypothetical protein
MSGYRSLTDQNLSAVLRFVNVQEPAASPLLVVPRGTHGGTTPLWVGPRSDEQLTELRAWVIRAALERASSNNSDFEVNQAAEQGEVPRKRDPFLGEILAEERPDRFDPAIFNRRVHGSE